MISHCVCAFRSHGRSCQMRKILLQSSLPLLGHVHQSPPTMVPSPHPSFFLSKLYRPTMSSTQTGKIGSQHSVYVPKYHILLPNILSISAPFRYIMRNNRTLVRVVESLKTTLNAYKIVWMLTLYRIHCIQSYFIRKYSDLLSL